MFTSTDVLKIYGLDRERFRDWICHGFIRYTVLPKGQGRKGYFDLDTIVQIGLFIHIIKSTKRKVAAEIVDSLIPKTAIERSFAGLSLKDCSYVYVVYDDNPSIHSVGMSVKFPYREVIEENYPMMSVYNLQPIFDKIMAYKKEVS